MLSMLVAICVVSPVLTACHNAGEDITIGRAVLNEAVTTIRAEGGGEASLTTAA